MTEPTADDLAVARATNQRLNARTQQLESELAAYRRAVAQWEINERGTYIPHASLRAIGLASGRDILGSVRHLRHFERVEQTEAAIERVRNLHDALDAETDLTSPDDEITRGAAARQIAAALDGWSPAAVPVPPPTDQTALRDRIAEALYESCTTEAEAIGPMTEAVLAVLPEPTGRAAVLREAADDLATAFGDPMAKHIGALGASHLRRRAREIEAGQAGEEQPETPLEKRLRYSERRNDELRAECKRRGKVKLEQAEKIQRLESQLDEVRGQLGAEILRAGQAEAELRRLAAEAQPTTRPEPDGEPFAGDKRPCLACGCSMDCHVRVDGEIVCAFEDCSDPTPAGVRQDGAQPSEPPVVAYRSDGGRLLNCLRHVPPPAARHAGFHPVTAEDLPDGGICTYPDCGVDVLIPQENRRG